MAMSLARNVLLAASTSRWLRDRAMKTPFVRRSVSAFMPGERLDDALNAARTEQRRGAGTIFTRLGENLTQASEAEAVAAHYLDALDRIAAAGLTTEISVKPTQLGLDFDEALCLRHLRALVERAAARGSFVWIDMESSAYVDATLRLFRDIRAGSAFVGVALQAYLHRTASDLESLLPLGPAVRLVKGAYLESATIAYARKADVDENFFRLASRVLDGKSAQAGTRLHIATHDDALIERLAPLAGRQGQIPCEYAMLYGIRRPLQQKLLDQKRPLRVLIAYGDYWFPWYMRRLAERPANLWFVVKNVVGLHS
jgi:proline dehydrogenase